MDDSAELQNTEEKVIFGARVVNPSDPDVFDNPDSARVRARQIGCIGIRRYNNRTGSASWMPCTNESDYRRVSGIGHSGRRFRRQQLERDVREIIGGRSGRKMNSKSANYTKPELRETIKKRIMAGSKGGQPGQWSARKAQLLALAYRKAGGGYKGGKTSKQRSLSKWTKQKWRTSDGKKARRGNVTRRYLPAAAWNRLTVGQRAATNRKKIEGSKRGRQFVANTEAARIARKRSVRGTKHVEFYEDIEFKAVGPRIGKITRRRNFGSSTGGRTARRLGNKLRGVFAVFDPNAIDADNDNVVQEGTIQERRIGPRIARAARRMAEGVADSLGRIRRRPQISEERAFGRAERLADGRYATTLPPSVARAKPSPRLVRQGTASISKITEARPTKRRETKRPKAEPSSAIRAAMNANVKPAIYPSKYEQDAISSIRNNRAEIYKQFTTGESTIAELADRFDSIRDEIQQAINQHKKFRKSNNDKFKNSNPRLARAIQNFGNSRSAFVEGIAEGKFRDWDSMVQYVFRNPDSSKNRDNMVEDLFGAFRSGKNPDRSSNLSLGYVPNTRKNDKRLVKTFSDSRKPRPNFRSLSEFETQPKRTASAASFAQRTPRSYRRDDLIAGAMSSGVSISGKMSSSMTPKQEMEWKKREWKRQQLKNFTLDPNASTKFPALSTVIGGKDITKAIEALDALDETSLENLWNTTVNDISSVPGMAVPAYTVKSAPLSPRELALAATVKRPLVKAFLDEYKKFNPSGIIANLNTDNMSDADVQSFFNTFILPELVNTGAPSTQEVEDAAKLVPSQVRISDAERLLQTMPSAFTTLEYRMKVATKALVESGYDVDSPEFDTALQEFLDDSEKKDLANFNDELQTWLNGGKSQKRIKKFAINPITKLPYSKRELEEQMDEIDEALEILNEKIDPQIQEEIGRIQALASVLGQSKALEAFLKDPRKTPDPDQIPINVATGKPYTLREWIESGAYKLFRMYDNPKTGKPFTDEELDETLDNLASQIAELNDKIGTVVLDEKNKLERFAQKLQKAYMDAGYGDDDEDDDVDMPGDIEDDGEDFSMKPDEPTIEEEQQRNQETLNQSADILDRKVDVPVGFTEDDVKNIRQSIDRVKGNQDPSSAAPDTDEFWAVYGPYDGDPNNPLNKVTDVDGNPVPLDSPVNQVDKDLWNEFIDSPYAREWSDIHNSHTIGRYTDVPEELAKYSGKFEEGVDPSKIDPKIRWDKLIEVLQQTNPELFRRDEQTGEIIGQTLDVLAQQIGLDAYGGASFSDFAGLVSEGGGEVIDTSGHQYKRLLAELAKAQRLEQENQYLSQTAAAAKERAKLWKQLEVGTLTPEEIAFNEGIRDINTVIQALNMHEVDNNISSAKRKNLQGVASTAAKTRQKTFEKQKLQKLIDGIREIARLSSPGVSPSADASDLKDTIDGAIEQLDKTITKIGNEYDQFRRMKQMLHGMVASLLKTRPGLFKADPNNPNQRNRFGQTGWNMAKEPLLRYLNRIERWDEEMFGYIDRRTGEKRRGLLQILVDYDRSLAIQTGDPAGSSATTAIYNRAKARKAELERFKGELESISRQAKSVGITGFMRSSTPLGRAEESSRRAARNAAAGRMGFVDPRILKRYDRNGFDVNKRMLGNASGFNKTFNREIQEAIRNNNPSVENASSFSRLNDKEKEYLRLLEAVNNTPRMFATEQTSVRKRQRGGKLTQAGINKQNDSRRFVTPYINSKPIETFKSGITGRMTTSREERIKNFGGKDRLTLGGLIEIAPEQLEDGRWYLVNRHGELMSPNSYTDEDKALKAGYALAARLRKEKRGQELPQNLAEYQSARLGIRQSGYRAESVHRQNVKDVLPIKPDGEKNKYIFGVDAKPKPRAGDTLIVRKNPDTGELEALVIERGYGPHMRDVEGTVALPGGMFDPKKDADLSATALREALEETGLDEGDLVSVQNLGTIDAPDWDPRFAKGIEVSAVLVEVPSTWEPKAGDDAVSARFVPLTEIANGNVPLGFGHAAWFEAAYAGHENPMLADLGNKFGHLNWLSRQRQQRIIRDVNRAREAYNAERLSREITLLDQENPPLNLFPRELPDASTSGWRPTGDDFERQIAAPRRLRIAKEFFAILDAKENERRKARGLPPKKPRYPDIPPGAVSGAMRAALVEMGPDEFDRIRFYPGGKETNSARKFIDDVLNLRLTGMDKYSIARFMGDKAALESELRRSGVDSPGPDRDFYMAGLAPTEELIYRIIADRKLNIRETSTSGNNRKLRALDPDDMHTKQRSSSAKDVMTLALEGMSTQEIAEILDLSKERTAATLRRLGMQDKDGSTVVGDIQNAIQRYENSPNQKAAYVDSVYKRLSLGEIAKKYNIGESEAREMIEAYRKNVESLEPEHHAVYRTALTNVEPDLLSRDEEQIMRMRLDGLSLDDIADVMKIDNGKAKVLEQRALYKLRRMNSDEFTGVKRDLEVIRFRRDPSTAYMVGKRFDIENDGVYLDARELRDFRNDDKDLYMMNQHMGTSVKELAMKFGRSEDDIRGSIDKYSSAIDTTDTIRHKALRRAIAINNAELNGTDMDFVNMRNDGASLDDMSRYFGVEKENLRANQIAIMTKLNNSDGISGAMKGVRGIDSRNLYRELGIDESSSQEEIDDAFVFNTRELLGRVMKNDPAAVAKYFDLSEAYKILASPAARESYNNMDFDGVDVVIDLPELDKLYDSWPTAVYREPGTERIRPTWVGDALLGEYNSYDNFIKMPHHLGSDEISDDIDDGFLGFGINDSDRKLEISDMMYRKPMPGTKEWDELKRQGDLARASGDPRYIFDENGFIIGQRENFISAFDDPMSPNYIGDRFGGAPKGSRPVRYMESSISGKMAVDKKKFPERPAPMGNYKGRNREGGRGIVAPNGEVNEYFTDEMYPLGQEILPTDDPLTVVRKLSEPDFLEINDMHDETGSLLMNFMNHNFDFNKDFPNAEFGSGRVDLTVESLSGDKDTDSFSFNQVYGRYGPVSRRYEAINELLPNLLDFLDTTGKKKFGDDELLMKLADDLEEYFKSFPGYESGESFENTSPGGRAARKFSRQTKKVLAYLRKHKSRLREYTPQPLGYDTVPNEQIRSYFEKVFPEGNTIEYTQRIFEQMRLNDILPTAPRPMMWAYNHHIPMPIFVAAFDNYKNTGSMYGITGQMKSLVPEGSWSIGETQDERVINGEIPKFKRNPFWEDRGYDSDFDLRPWADFGETLAADYFGWLNLPEGDDDKYLNEAYLKKGNLTDLSADFAAMGNLRVASVMRFSPSELLDAIDELYENMPPAARQRATSRSERTYGGLEYFRYAKTPVRPFLRHVESVPLLRDIASGKIREFVYYDRALYPGRIINRDGELYLTRQRSYYNPELGSFVEETEEKYVNKQFETELGPVQLNMDEDPEKAETYLKAVIIGSAISGPWLESNSSNIESQLLQQSVRRVFNLTNSLEPSELPGAQGSYRLGQSDYPDPADGETLLDSLKKEYPLPPALKNFLDEWVRTTYEQTQEYLSSLGDDAYIHLYRGASFPDMIEGRDTEVPEPVTGKWLRSGAGSYLNEKQMKEELDFRQAPISSWTLSPAWARVFSYGEFGPAEAKVGSTRESTIDRIRGASVIDAPIPKTSILSLPHSGLGTMQSGEVIVIGETLERVRIRHSDSLPKSLWLVADVWDDDFNARYQGLDGKVWSSKGQRHFVGNLRSGWGDSLVVDMSAEQYLHNTQIVGKMSSSPKIQSPYRTSDNWTDYSTATGRMSLSSRGFVKRFARSLGDDERRYPFDSKPTKSDMQLIRDASQRLRQTELLPMAKVYDFEFSGPDGELYNSGILTLAQRPVVVVRFYDEIDVPFYMSSGRGRKKNVIPGRWYPFWGIGRDGWFNKTTERDINNFYGIPELRVAAARLDEILPESSMPKSNIKWNNGDLDWMPREKMSIAERQKRLRAAQRAIRQADELNPPDAQGNSARQEYRRFVGFPVKDSLTPVINGRRNVIDSFGNPSVLAKSIARTRQKFEDTRNEILRIAIPDETSRRVPAGTTTRSFRRQRGTSNEWAKRIVRDMPDGVFDTTISGKMSLPRKNWSNRDFYKDLDANKNDSLEALKKKYREMVKRFHPDKNKNDTAAAARFRAAAEAWEILSDAEKRNDYDNNFYPEIERRSQQGQTGGTGGRRFPFGFTSQRNQNEPNAEPEETRPTSPPPPRPPARNPRSGANLPPMEKTLSDRIGFVPPAIAHDPNLWDSMRNHTPEKPTDGIDVPNTFGQGTTKVTEERFFDLYTKVAVGMSDAVKQQRKTGEPKRFVSVGGAPGSGKSTMRKTGEANIPDVNSAVHVDADEIKTIIPEAIAAHAAGDTEWATVAHEESRVIADMALRVALDRDIDVVYDSTGQYNRGYGTLQAAKAKGYEIVAHYVVAPEEILQDRVVARQLNDPRIMPKHIIPATMSRNFQIMPDVAKMADEFYLWDSSGDSKVLLARKIKGGQLEILDSRAFAHGNFFNDFPNHPLLDRPDLSKFPNRKKDAHQNKDVFRIHRMFADGKTVSEIAKELKTNKGWVFQTLTEKDPLAPGQSDAGDFNPYRPFRNEPNTGSEGDFDPDPDETDDDTEDYNVYEDYPDDDVEDYLEEDEENDEDFGPDRDGSLIDPGEEIIPPWWNQGQGDIPIPGNPQGTKPFIIDGPPIDKGVVPDILPDRGVIAYLLHTNSGAKTILRILANASNSSVYNKTVGDWLKGIITDSELTQQLDKWNLRADFKPLLNFADRIKAVFPFKNETFTPMTDVEVEAYARDVLGDYHTKELAMMFNEIDAISLKPTSPIMRVWADSHSTPMNFIRSAHAKFRRTGSIAGKMSNENPFGDMSKTIDDLDDELKDHIYENGIFGKHIKHPLLFWMAPITPNMIDFINKGLAAKQAAAEDALKKKNWNSYIYLHERPYRIDAFEDIMGSMTDEEYWSHLSDIWVDSENIGAQPERWKELLMSNRGSREFFMRDDERAELAKLPDKFTVYRGYSENDPEEFGMSWSTDPLVAEWFARRFARNNDKIIMEELEVAKDEVFAYVTRRGEDEIILDMKKAKERMAKKKQLPSKSKTQQAKQEKARRSKRRKKKS